MSAPLANSIMDLRLGRRNRCGFSRLLALAAFLGLCLGVLSPANGQIPAAQNGATRVRQQMRQVPQIGMSSGMGRNPTFEQHRIRQLNIERQKELVSETNDLLKLTAQLNAQVAKNKSSSLTPDQVRMVAKIEKLAKSVREKMSTPVRGSVFEDNFPPPMGQPVIP